MIYTIDSDRQPHPISDPVRAANMYGRTIVALDLVPTATAPVSVIEVGELTRLAGGINSRKRVSYNDGKVTRRIRRYLKLNGFELFHARSASEMQSAVDAGAWLNPDERLSVLANLAGDQYVVIVRPDSPEGRLLLDDGVPLVYNVPENFPPPTDLTARVQIGNALDVIAVVRWLLATTSS